VAEPRINSSLIYRHNYIHAPKPSHLFGLIFILQEQKLISYISIMSPSLSPFDPKAYYRFSNAAYPYTGISTGFKYENTPPHLGLTPYGSRSSENWQIYRQRDNSGRSVYLIRNYDYGAALQLGLTEEVRAVPRLLPRSGDLGQQWRLQVVDGK
jgi:hypothetical protein